MNRKLMMGIAIFLAVIGTAMMGVEKEAEAGRRCGGGLFAKLHARKAACGAPADCAAPAPPPACAGPVECGGGGDCGGGGFLSRLRAKHAARKAARKADCGKPADCGAPPAPEPCCEPAPAPEPCCAPEPAPAPCCEAAPAPVAAPCCAAPAPVVAPVASPCCGMVSEPIVYPTPVVESVPMAAPCCGGEMIMDSGISYGGGVVYEGSPSDSYYGGGSIMVNEAGEEIVPGSVQVIGDGTGEVSAEDEVPVVAPGDDDGI